MIKLLDIINELEVNIPFPRFNDINKLRDFIYKGEKEFHLFLKLAPLEQLGFPSECISWFLDDYKDEALNIKVIDYYYDIDNSIGMDENFDVLVIEDQESNSFYVTLDKDIATYKSAINVNGLYFFVF